MDPLSAHAPRPPRLLAQVREAIHLKRYSIRTVQLLLGDQAVKTTMIYTHALTRGGLAVRSPLD